MTSRRCFLTKLGAAGLLPGLLLQTSHVQARTLRASSPVMWGGLGYAVGNDMIGSRFPMVNAAVASMGGGGRLESAFTQQLTRSYPGGLQADPRKMIDAGDDPSLLFTVSLDYEQMILVPTEDGTKEFQLSFIYAAAQVLYFVLPRPGGTDGDLKILYSFPFRVQSAEAPFTNQKNEQIRNFRNLLVSLDNSLINVFSRKVANKKFVEVGNNPNRIKVKSVAMTSEATGVIKDLGVEGTLSRDFFGQAFTASMAEQSDASVTPFSQNDTLNGALASRFNQFPNISNVFSHLTDDEHYVVELTVYRVLRQPNGSNIGNVLYARGMSLYVKVIDTIRNNVVFNKKILLVENHELPKVMFDKLKDFDTRYLVQIAIKLFDSFIGGIMKEDKELLKTAGLDPDNDMGEVRAFKEVLLKCRYA